MSLSPMMSHYLETKKAYEDCILFYRLGDFYEMFYDDALTASRELELTLTGKDCGLEERAPMCGIPFHAADNYINKLVSKGYKVAIAEQVEDPKLAKGLVKREVIRIVTPGTNTNNLALNEDKNNYLMGIYYASDYYAVAFADITTGSFLATQIDSERELMDEINKFPVAEIISNHAFNMAPVEFSYIKDRLGISLYNLTDGDFAYGSCVEIIKKHFNVIDLSGLGLVDHAGLVPIVGAVLHYLYETQKTGLEILNKLTIYSSGKYMIIDSATRRNLELTETMREKNKKGSLLWVLDKTKTAMGARRIRYFIEQPLIEREEIIRRQDAVEELNSSLIDRDELREYLGPIYDLERLLAKISYRSANPRDILAFKNSLHMLPAIKNVLAGYKSSAIKEIYESFDCLEDLYKLIDDAMVDDPPISLKDGGIIKEGYLDDIDKLRRSKTDGKMWLAQMEAKEREDTGIKSLKIRFNKVFGYYIEVTNSYKDLVPDRYIRKQTLVNAERYITDELKKLEDLIVGAEDKLFSMEYDIFNEIRDDIASQITRIQKTASAVAQIDAFCSLAFVAEQNRYVRPQINTNGVIDVKEGRHPVIEQVIGDGMFIPNDTYCDQNDNRISIITGPNMAGKSTYMRQLALIVLMASIGSFVPAASANICICDRIFTRVGASDDLASGQSTFMVEMTEVANILRNATRNSLVILDEIGRGTSTYDGLGIAWAVVEYIADIRKCGAKTLFSTHYHELTELEGRIDGVKNYCVTVKEQGRDIVFLRKIARGGADRSYGIQVASLAGVPDEIITRAFEIVEKLVSSDITVQRIPSSSADRCDRDTPCADLHKNDEEKTSAEKVEAEVINSLKKVDMNSVTLIDAMNILYELKSRLNNC